jgi:hypothetical protein
MTGASVTTSLTQRAFSPLNQDVSLALRNAAMLPCCVPEAALVKPGSSNMTHDSRFISLIPSVTSGLSVMTLISVLTVNDILEEGGLVATLKERGYEVEVVSR